jgi:hypothetical protein
MGKAMTGVMPGAEAKLPEPAGRLSAEIINQIVGAVIAALPGSPSNQVQAIGHGAVA